jgi:hypothetical protein
VCATALAFKTDMTGVGGQGKWEAKWASLGEQCRWPWNLPWHIDAVRGHDAGPERGRLPLQQASCGRDSGDSGTEHGSSPMRLHMVGTVGIK